MKIRAALCVIILTCVLAFGQEAEELVYSSPLDKISTFAEVPLSLALTPTNESHSMPAPVSIVDAAIAEDNLNAFVAAIRSADLVELLNGPGPFTIFAPNDKAFAKISEADLEDILRTNQTLASVLTYHMVEGNISSADFKNGMKVTSEEGGTLTFNISSKGLMVSNANIIKADVVASNGIIHVIDNVLGYKALSTQPQTSNDWLDKGIALKDMGKNNEALKALEKATEKDPQLAEAWHEKGLILEILGRKKEAQAAFAKART
jgi:uncharacterized surface protein with fasciclin (FAS1) repeats